MTYRTSLPLHPTEDDKPKKKIKVAKSDYGKMPKNPELAIRLSKKQKEMGFLDKRKLDKSWRSAPKLKKGGPKKLGFMESREERTRKYKERYIEKHRRP
tara:strand:+ start:140 stop:436 length:297 start_codon:yes stop_codon:yes gene_type:complete